MAASNENPAEHALALDKLFDVGFENTIAPPELVQLFFAKFNIFEYERLQIGSHMQLKTSSHSSPLFHLLDELLVSSADRNLSNDYFLLAYRCNSRPQKQASIRKANHWCQGRMTQKVAKSGEGKKTGWPYKGYSIERLKYLNSKRKIKEKDFSYCFQFTHSNQDQPTYLAFQMSAAEKKVKICLDDKEDEGSPTVCDANK